MEDIFDYQQQIWKQVGIMIESLLLVKYWSPKSLLLYVNLVSFSLLKVTFNGLPDTSQPWKSFCQAQVIFHQVN